MEEGKKAYRAHCLVVPYPTAGHINPMLQFSKRLEHKGIKVTLAVTKFIYRTMHKVSDTIAIETFSDGKEATGEIEFESYQHRLRVIGSQTLTQLLEKLRDSGHPVDCIIYDAFLTWGLDVARKFEVVAAVFFTQSCAVNNIYYHVHKGLLKVPIPANVEKVKIAGLPPLESSEMPSFIHVVGSYPTIFQFLLDQFSNFHMADWLLFNTFYELEQEVVDWMAKQWPLRTIGPTVPSTYLDQRLEGDKDYDLNLFNPNAKACIKWLDGQSHGSVAYVAFGSLAELGIEQMEELAWGLKASDKNFLWVVRATEAEKIPKNFMEETSEKGLVVSWCPQLEVLAHSAVGCFVTHCGWNSTLEALSLGVPVVAMGQWTDQITNAKYSMDEWKNGIRPPINDNGIVTRDEVEHCLKEIMDGEKGKEIRKNANRWKELAKQAVDEGGSSDRNIDDFVASLIQFKKPCF